MEPLGIIGGSAFARSGVLDNAELREVRTERGPVTVQEGDGFVFLRRHGHETYRPAHRIPHHAHALAFEELGVEEVVALCSVGSLQPRLRPGTVVVPEDYLSWRTPPTFAGDERLHIVPGLDADLRGRVLDLARRVADGHDAWPRTALDSPSRRDVCNGGVYAETSGPRFETRAEVRLLADYADVVGMTGASEATLLQERGIASAILAIVDNHAHGIGAEPLTLEAFDAQLEKNADRARALLAALTKETPWTS